MNSRSGVARLSAAVLLSAGVSGCAVLGAGRDTLAPPLEVPEAPPRVVAAFPDELEEPEGEPVAVVTPPEIDVASETEVTGGVAAAPAPESDPAPEADATAEATPPPDSDQEQAVPSLELAPAPEDDVDASVVRRGLRSTALILDGIDRTSLDAPGRAQRDTARRFLVQATAALQAGNVTYARFLTEKAEALARDLENR